MARDTSKPRPSSSKAPGRKFSTTTLVLATSFFRMSPGPLFLLQVERDGALVGTRRQEVAAHIGLGQAPGRGRGHRLWSWSLAVFHLDDVGARSRCELVGREWPRQHILRRMLDDPDAFERAHGGYSLGIPTELYPLPGGARQSAPPCRAWRERLGVTAPADAAAAPIHRSRFPPAPGASGPRSSSSAGWRWWWSPPSSGRPLAPPSWFRLMWDAAISVDGCCSARSIGVLAGTNRTCAARSPPTVLVSLLTSAALARAGHGRHVLPVWHLALASFVNGIAWAADNPGRRTPSG